MRASKYTLIVCWIITIVSFGAIVILHEEIDIRIQEAITQTKWLYDFDERNFYQGIWSNIFTGAIVSVMTTYVTYFRQKHDIEFDLKMSETMLTLKLGLLASPIYAVDPKQSQNNHAAIARFANQIVVYENDNEIKETIDKTRETTSAWHEQLKELYEALNKL